MADPRRIRFRMPDDDNAAAPSEELDSQTLAWSLKTKQELEANMHQCDLNVVATLLETLYTTNQEELLLHVTTCLRLLWSVPLQPLRFHSSLPSTSSLDYTPFLELIGSDNDLIASNCKNTFFFFDIFFSPLFPSFDDSLRLSTTTPKQRFQNLTTTLIHFSFSYFFL